MKAEELRAEELRIGNLVKDIDGNIFNIKQENLCDFANGFIVVKPIPLTEEWLLKFGFEKTLNQYKKLTLSNKIGCDNIPFIILFLDNQYQYDDLRFRTNIQYVHNFQNLFFALTGEELTIKK